jgi:long-chain acyl-CoA synthetase
MRAADIGAARVPGPGERGEPMFRAPMVMDGYYGNPEGTTEAIEPDGWLHSGDIATVGQDGHFTIVDRKKDMNLTAGFNVYPAEPERVPCMHPAVALAAVTGVPGEVKGELAKACIVANPGMDISREAIVAHCQEHLAAYKIPRAVQFIEQVPMTSSGKMMRRLLKDLDDGTR